MKEFNTAKREYFYSQQTRLPITSNVYDLERQALSEKLSITLLTKFDILQAWRVYFNSEGISNSYTRNLSDLWYEWLGTKGFTGSLRDRQRQFYNSGVNL